MHRRAFLGTLSAGLAGMVLDPERALWVPGRRTYHDMGAFVRPPTAWLWRVRGIDGSVVGAWSAPRLLSPGDGAGRDTESFGVWRILAEDAPEVETSDYCEVVTYDFSFEPLSRQRP